MISSEIILVKKGYQFTQSCSREAFDSTDLNSYFGESTPLVARIKSKCRCKAVDTSGHNEAFEKWMWILDDGKTLKW